MKKQIVHSLSKPQNIETDKYHVYVNTDITENEITHDDETIKEYTYTQRMYETQEYIMLLHSQINDILEVLTEVE